MDGIYDSDAQISMIRADLVKGISSEGEGKIEITSAFGENEVAPLKIIPMRIDDKIHREVLITCTISKKICE